MASVIQTIGSVFERAWESRDARVDDWPLMGSPSSVVFISVSYFVLAKFVGPWFMEKRNRFDLKGIMLAYNIFQMVANVWIVSVLGKGWWAGHVPFFCDPGELYSNPDVGIPVLRGAYFFFFIKFFDFFDTLFFILRKKINHVSWLHVYHHAIMPIVVWIGIRFVGGSPGIFDACINSSIHVIMYFYYFLTGLGPRFKKFLFWKKYLTMMQMGQFVLLAFHSLVLLFQKDCDIPVAHYGAVIFPLETSFFILFMNFYKKTYVKKLD